RVRSEVMADDDPFYSPKLKPQPPRVPQPGEMLFEFLVGHDRYLFELRDHGEVYGVECQVFKNEEFWYARAATTRSAARAPDRRPARDARMLRRRRPAWSSCSTGQKS